MIFNYDVVVVGAGHAGCEAAAAAANLGARTCLITMDMNKIAQMSCNPAIGGIAKGQIVREIDALGGYTGIVTDRCSLQFRMLNLSKGPAVWSPRSQCDRAKFIWTWREILENIPNLQIWQDQVRELVVENQIVKGVKTFYGAEFQAKCVIITAGTFLNGLMHIGRVKIQGGRCAEAASLELTESITKHGIRAGRMKTGTPVRIDKRSVDFSLMELQDGDHDFHKFSYLPTEQMSVSKRNNLPCWICYTNTEVHEVLRSGLPDSPLYNGQIQSIGPRYCPSIETKLHTFPDRDEHMLFLEPEGETTNEMYLNGFSSSLPQLTHSLESKVVKNLFFAGQVNGTTGYEEAAGQGVIAGINAAINCNPSLHKGEAFTLGRNEAYIGVLIDDLVTKGVDEPYRMFTSRAEYRILLRQDDADMRLTERSYQLGLATKERYQLMLSKKEKIDAITAFVANFSLKPSLINPSLEALGTTPLRQGCKLEELLGRPQININNIAPHIDTFRKELERILGDDPRREEIIEAAEIQIKYKGYIYREQQMADKMIRLENIKILGKFDYPNMTQISIEARQKLQAIQPVTLAQASRIPGVSPSDINIMLVLMGR